MSDIPRVSVVVKSYNYARFLPDAIDSALAQTYPHIEVVVVDDGSTDESREVIARYAGRVIPVLKGNGGQASAFNAGFAASRGEVVIFLDADDRLLPDTAARVAAAFQADPTLAKVQYRMADIDAAGRPTGTFRPPAHVRMPSGDIRPSVLRFPDDIPYQPTSGNAFARWMLHRIFPVPEEDYRICADIYVSNISSLFGPVVWLDEVGAQYRVHGENNHADTALRLDRTRRIIVTTGHTHRYLERFADTLGLPGFPRESRKVLSVTFIAHRMISLKMARREHPVGGDTRMALCVSGVMATLRHFDFPPPKKLLYIAWFTAMVPAPAPIARWLANKLFHPGSPGRVCGALATPLGAVRAIRHAEEGTPYTGPSSGRVASVSELRHEMNRPGAPHMSDAQPLLADGACACHTAVPERWTSRGSPCAF